MTLPGGFILILRSFITAARFILGGRAGMMLVTAAVLVFITFRAGRLILGTARGAFVPGTA